MPSDREGKGRPTIATLSGLEFSPLAPKQHQICIQDITHGLALTCRYAAQVPKFYSVAEHSVRVCELLEKRFPKDIALHQWGLLHDASEAYLGDMPRPLKLLDPRYQEIEDRVMRVIAELFCLGPREEPKEVRIADFDVFLREKETLWADVKWWHTEKAPDDTKDLEIQSLAPEQAKALFRSKFDQIFGV